MMRSNIIVVEATAKYIDDIPIEMVERKGIGHPDTLCDNIAERVSREYTRWCQENLGGILHHNFDKVQLVAGEVDVLSMSKTPSSLIFLAFSLQDHHPIPSFIFSYF
jgi:S-adenosylmethionine synthetase